MPFSGTISGMYTEHRNPTDVKLPVKLYLFVIFTNQIDKYYNYYNPLY